MRKIETNIQYNICNPLYNTFEITKAEPNGNVIFKIETVIKAKKGGLCRLDLEQLLKNEID